MTAYTVTCETNFVRVIRLPLKWPAGYCFQGGHLVQVLLVDWFNPLGGLNEEWPVILEGQTLEDKRAELVKFVKTKSYYQSGYDYLLLLNYGDSVFIPRLKEAPHEL